MPRGKTKFDWDAKRAELTALIEQVIRRGNDSGEMNDPHPRITALCIPGMVRSVMLFGRQGLEEADVAAQILRLVRHGVGARSEKGD